MTSNEGDRFGIPKTRSTTSLRLLGRYKSTVRAIFFPPFTQPLTPITLGPIVDRLNALDFCSIRCWLLMIVNLARDSDLSLIPRPPALPGMSAGSDDDDNFRFWSERQAQRIARAIRTVLWGSSATAEPPGNVHTFWHCRACRYIRINKHHS